MSIEQPSQNLPPKENPSPKESTILEFAREEREIMAREFFGLSADEFAAFKKRITENQGHVRAFVHPFYISRHPEHYTNKIGTHKYSETDPTIAAEHLENGFLRTVENVIKDPDSVPLIIFEDEDLVEQTRQDIQARLGKPIEFTGSGIIFSATGKASDGSSASGSPSPEMVRAAYQQVRPDAVDAKIDYESNFRIYEEVLKALGIQSVTMGGAYFLDWYRPEDKLGACAGNVRKIFNRLDIPVNLSRYSVTPREQLATHYPTKQTRDKKEG